ncbi:MAG TPA: DUF4198 domain-containing protein [Candidatus Binatia bacterium]|jgi:uncharacterized GH25 family protein|nr:DUF4198 domain-containing protein [Candidatus Binatia bacterium]
MKKYPFLRAFRLASLIFGLAQNALAHDGWIEISPWIAEKGQPVTVALMHGNHSNEHRSFRLAGKWDPTYTRLQLFDPSGKQMDLSNQLIDLGEDPEKTGPKGPKGFHIASFTAKEEGVYTLLARQERVVTEEQTGAKLRSIRTARGTFAALAVPTVREAKKLKSPNQFLGGDDNLEIVPLAGLLGLTSEELVTLEVRFKGKPAPGRVVSVIRKTGGATSAQDFTTDDQGRIRFIAGPADFYLSRVKFDEAGERDKSTYEATYVFQVFNRP